MGNCRNKIIQMKNLFDITQVDINCYQKVIGDFLPDKIIDVHTHVYLKKHLKEDDRADGRTVAWPELVAQENPIEDLSETYKLFFPGKTVTPVIFAFPVKLKDLDRANEYIIQCCKANQCFGFILAKPEWTAGEFEKKIMAGNFYGAKVYLNFSPSHIPSKDICIFDFLPHHQLEILNKLGLIVMLHIPREKRLRDPLNLAQIIEIEKKYPNIKLIIAHVGRAYCAEDVGNAFDILSETKNVLFDFSANTNKWVFEQLIKAVGPSRILFGSDLPITRMRMKRVCENGMYINIVPKGMYGDISSDKNMRETDNHERAPLTFFMYEEIAAFRLAAQATKLTQNDIEDVFYNNAVRILRK